MADAEVKMIVRILIVSNIFLLIAIVKCQSVTTSLRQEILEAALRETTEFFQQLKAEYDVHEANDSVLAEIDEKIAEHVRNSINREKDSIRQKRGMSSSNMLNKGVMVLDGLNESLEFDFKDAKNIEIFKLRTNFQTLWLLGVLDASGLSIFEITGKTINEIGNYQERNCIKIIAEDCESGVLLIIQKQDGVVFLRLVKENENYSLEKIQEFFSGSISDLASWHGMNQLHLGVATNRNLSIYTWFGEHFDLVQVLNIGAKNILPFYAKGFVHLATTGPMTIILRYSLRSNEFEIMQRLPSGDEAMSFSVNEGHFTDYYLALTAGDSVIVYKEVRDRFMPFQKINSGKTVLSFTREKVVVLFSLKNHRLLAYQYDGWRFVPVDVNFEGIKRIRKINLYDQEYLLIENDHYRFRLLELIWSRKKSWESLQSEIKNWCEDAKLKASRNVTEIPKFHGILKISNGRIGKVSAININGHNANETLNIIKKQEELLSKLENEKSILKSKKPLKNPVFNSLTAKKVTVKCNRTCKASQVNIDKKKNPFQKFRNWERDNSILKFKFLAIKDAPGLLCPIPAISIKNITLKGLINSQSLEDLNKNLLKLAGNQTIPGPHMIEKLEVISVEMPLDVAYRSTNQITLAKKIKARELNLTEGGFLLPLNGEATTMPGKIRAKIVKLKNKSILKGGLRGLEKSEPVKLHNAPMKLLGNYTLRNIKVENLFDVRDIISVGGKSLVKILENSVPLGGPVPLELDVSADNMRWTNVSFSGWNNLIVNNKHSKSPITISGRKYVPQNIIVKKENFKNPFPPKIGGKLCASAAVAPEIKTVALNLNSLTAGVITAPEMIGNLKLPAANLSEFPRNRTYKQLKVNNLTVGKVNDLNCKIEEVEQILQKFEEPNVYRGKMEMKNLSVDVLRAPIQFSLPPRVKEIVAKGNCNVKTINGVNLNDFFNNVVSIHDSATLGNISFEGELIGNSINISHPSFNLSNSILKSHSKSAIIAGNLRTNSINIPQDFKFDDYEPKEIFIQGSAKFLREPSLGTVNGVNLEELKKNIWMKNEEIIFVGSNLHFLNAEFTNISTKRKLKPLNADSWTDLSNKILSKSKAQDIGVPVVLSNLEVPFIRGVENSTIRSEVQDINDILENCFTRNGPQVVSAHWEFDKVKISEKAILWGKVNSLNLNKDIVLHGAQENIVTGKKMILDLATEDFHGLEFDKWSRNVFIDRGRKLVTVKGRKTFGNVTIPTLSVGGTIMGKRVDDAILKSRDQRIISSKIIEGDVEVPGVIINGLINDINFTELVSSQLKKKPQENLQVIQSEIEFLNDFKVQGNLGLIDLYNDKGLMQFGKEFERISTEEEILGIGQLVDGIQNALGNRLIFLDKFEEIDPSSLHSTNTIDNFDPKRRQKCELSNSSLTCNSKSYNINPEMRLDSFFSIELITVQDTQDFIVLTSKDQVCLYSVNKTDDQVVPYRELNIPGIIEVEAEPAEEFLWIILRLNTQTLVLRLHFWDSENLLEHILPKTEFLATSWTPNEQLLLITSNGIWNLEGMGEPQKILDKSLKGEIQTFARGADFFVEITTETKKTILKAKYLGT